MVIGRYLIVRLLVVLVLFPNGHDTARFSHPGVLPARN